MKRSLWARLPGAFARRSARWFGRRMFTLRNRAPIITFTFDDFPRTALSIAGDALEKVGARGTYFVSYGLMGQDTPTGEAFHHDDLSQLLARGHELGCHTYHHYPAWETSVTNYMISVARNAESLRAPPFGAHLQTHSYPISYPRPRSKRRLQRHFRACRGGGQIFNSGTVDLNYLSSVFLEQIHGDLRTVDRLIAENTAACGWLIFSTHDVCENPTRFGCTPSFFSAVVNRAKASGAELQVMTAALDAAGVRT